MRRAVLLTLVFCACAPEHAAGRAGDEPSPPDASFAAEDVKARLAPDASFAADEMKASPGPAADARLPGETSPPVDSAAPADRTAAALPPDAGAMLPAGKGAHIERDGVLLFEVESEAATAGWSKKTALAEFTGTAYYEWTGADSGAGGKGLLVYQFRVASPGNYELRWRNRIAQGTSTTECNDSFVRFPTGQNVATEQALSGWTKVYMNKAGAWTWDTKTVDHNPQRIRQFFPAGLHRIEVSGRSQGHAVDRISLRKYDTVAFDEAAFTAMAPSGREP